MKKLVFVAAVLSAALILALPLLAAEPEEAQIYSADDFDAGSIIDALPEEVREYLPDDGDIFDPDRALDGYSVGYFARVCSKLIGAALDPALKTLSVMLGLVIVSSAIGALKGAVKSDSLTAVFDFASGLCIMLALFNTISGLFSNAVIYLNSLSSLVSAMLPVMTAINIAGGNISAAAVSSNAMMLGLTFVELLAAKGLFPVLQLCFGISIASGIGGGLKLEGITKLVRGAFSWILGLIAAVISAVMSFQNSIAASADSLAMRGIKFAASGAIPVVGGIAGDAVRTVAGSLTLIKSTVGWIGVVLIALLTLPVIIDVLLTRLGVVIAETAAGVIGLEREKTLLGEMSGLLGFLAAVCVIAALMFVYALTLFARCGAAIGS